MPVSAIDLDRLLDLRVAIGRMGEELQAHSSALLLVALLPKMARIFGAQGRASDA
jgi:hypothetical protein